MANEPVGRKDPKIYSAIVGVMNDIGVVSKDKTCKSNFGSYKFRGIDDVMNALHPAMVKNKVFALPEVIEMTRETKETKNGAQMILTVCKVRYVFFTDDGSCVECVVPGEGMDTGDKSANKAMSAAFKYACFQTFCIPTEEMDDPDAERPEETAEKENSDKKQPVKQEPKKTDAKKEEVPEHPKKEQEAGNAKITEAMLSDIRAEQKRTGVSDNTILSMRQVKAKRMEDITVHEYEIIMKKFAITKKPVAQEVKANE